MPNYEYKCEGCLERVEVLRKVDERDLALPCPKCREPLQRVIGAAALQFVGGGWAKDGYSS